MKYLMNFAALLGDLNKMFSDRYCSRSMAFNLSYSESLPVVCRGRWHTGLALLLLLGACANGPDIADYPPEVRTHEHLRYLAQHIIEVDGDGEGDEIDMPEEVRGWCPGAEFAEANIEAGDEIVLREQFKCVITAALNAHRSWISTSKDGEMRDTKTWPCGENQRHEAEENPSLPLCMVFYFNGGLNAKHQVINTAATTYKKIEMDRMYPIYMVWPTGGAESYLEDVTRVRSGRLTNWDNPSTLASTPVRPVSDLLRGLASTPAAWVTSLFELFQTGFGFRSEAYMLKRDWDLHLYSESPNPDGQIFQVKGNKNLYFTPWEDYFQATSTLPALPDGEPVADLLVQDGTAATAKQLASFAYHGATSPVRALTTWPMVGLGEVGWRNMVRRTRTSVRSAAEFSDEFADEAEVPGDAGSKTDWRSLYESMRSQKLTDLTYENWRKHCSSLLEGEAGKLQLCYPRGSGGFARVFQWLQTCMTEQAIEVGADDCPLYDPNARDLMLDPAKDLETLRNARIVMIGHSMGTIVINELLEIYPDLPYDSLVYMAGAASVRDTARAVAPVLMSNCGHTKFYGLMLHPMNEARESNKYGLLPSGSLLTYVDDFLEVPKHVPDRTVGQWRNLRETQHLFFPAEARQWMLLHVFDRAEAVKQLDHGTYRNPTTHGAFNDEDVPFWQEAFWKPTNIQFGAPKAGCRNLFASRLEPKVAGAQEITIPADDMPRKWQTIRRELEAGKTLIITSGGRTIATIQPVTDNNESAAAADLPR